MKYRKKPVVIEAVKFTDIDKGDPCFDDVPSWLMRALQYNEVHVNSESTISVKTLEGPINARIGDMLICGVRGEIYPCKPDIFEATYEIAST